MSAPRQLATLERIEITSRQHWRNWLAAHHDQTESIWVVTWKKALDLHVPYADIRDEALCFGWIDSVPAKLDADRSMLLVSPRKKSSGWSAINKARIAALEGENRMTDLGRQKVLDAERDGSWTRLDAAHALIMPDDLVAALAAAELATEKFVAFPASTRRGILEWISTAKRPETRIARVQETARLAASGIRANQPRSKTGQ